MKRYWSVFALYCACGLAPIADAVAQENAAETHAFDRQAADELPEINRAQPDVVPLPVPDAQHILQIYREHRAPGSVSRQLEDYRDCMRQVRAESADAANAVDPREACRSTLAEVEQRMAPALRQALETGSPVESSAAIDP
jgi:hypothetical protein